MCIVPISHVLTMFFQVIVFSIIIVHCISNTSRSNYTQLSHIIVIVVLARTLCDYVDLVGIRTKEYKVTLSGILSSNKIIFCMFFLIFILITYGHTLIKHECLPIIITLLLNTYKYTIYKRWNRFTLIFCIQLDVSFVHLMSLKFTIKTIFFKIR